MSAFTDSLRKVAKDQNSEQDELTILEAAAKLDKLDREAAARSRAGLQEELDGNS